MAECDPVGIPDIAERLGVAATTPHQWKTRGLLPAPDYTISGIVLAWDWRKVLRWAGLNGRIYRPEAIEEYREYFGEEPRQPRLGGAGAVVPTPEAKPKRKRNASIGRARG